jgi:hypothetical protein
MILIHYFVGNLVIRSDIPLHSTPEIEVSDVFDVLLRGIDFTIPSILEKVPKLSRLGNNPSVSSIDDEFWIDWGEHGCFKISKGNVIEYSTLAASSPHFEHFLVNEVMATIFFQRGFFLLHGSAARLPNGRAAIFYGEPGAGKSTTLGFFIKNGAQILTDEVVVVGFDEDNRPFVVPFLPILRLWEHSAKQLGFIDDKTEYKYEIELKKNFSTGAVELQYVFSLQNLEQVEFSVTANKKAKAHLSLIANFTLPDLLLNSKASQERFTDAALILDACDFYEIKRNCGSFGEMSTFVDKFINETLKY